MIKENKIIAEFMGCTNPFNELKYHESWDWLMLVVDRCFYIHHEYSDELSFLLNDALLTTNIDEVYNAVLKFINEYNKEI